MKSTYLIIASILAGACIIAFGFSRTDNKAVGSAVSAPLYWNTTNSSVACPSATSTALLIAGTARNYFGVTNDGSNNVYVCKGATCAVSTGIRLNSSGGAYEQQIANDGYTGPYSCIAASATTTVNITYSQ